MRYQCRHPIVGDMLIVTPCRDRYQHIPPGQDEEEFLGIIYEIHRDRYGHQSKVFVQWSDNIPPNYNITYGYNGTNIHNLRHEFKIIRDGKEVVG